VFPGRARGEPRPYRSKSGSSRRELISANRLPSTGRSACSWDQGSGSGTHVRAQRVADHQELGGLHVEALQDPSVGGLVLLGYHLDLPEAVSDARPGNARLLVEEVALGEEHQTQARPSQAVHRLFRAVQQHDRALQHLPAELHQLLDLLAGDLPVRHLHRGLDDRERETLDAVAEEAQVAALDREEAVLEVRYVRVTPDDLSQPLLGPLVALLVVPERVVAIDTHHPDSVESRHHLEFWRRGRGKPRPYEPPNRLPTSEPSPPGWGR
jgi:hypothetical protein